MQEEEQGPVSRRGRKIDSSSRSRVSNDGDEHNADWKKKAEEYHISPTRQFASRAHRLAESSFSPVMSSTVFCDSGKGTNFVD
jgi:hypothetical protein